MKIGDTIICKDDKNSNSLNLNKEYIIVQINSFGNIGVQENFGARFLLPHFYKPERFTLVKQKTKTKNIDFSKTYETRNGGAVNLFCLSNSSEYPVVGEYNDNGEWVNGTWTMDGRFVRTSDEDECDLVEVITEKEVDIGGTTVRVYDDKSVYICDANISWTNEEMKQLVAAWQSFN